MIFSVFQKKLGFGVFVASTSVLLSASVERCFLSRMRDFLAVSRALEEFEQEFYIKERKPERHTFLVLAINKVWNIMTNVEICNFLVTYGRYTQKKLVKGGATEKTIVVQ